MAIPSTKEILDASPFNRGGKEEVPPFKRSMYFELERVSSKKFVIALTGLRRVGKSTLLKQILCKKRGAYFSFDEKKYQTQESLSAVIETFIDHGFSTMVLDEIGNIDDWSGTIKKYYDKLGIKFYVSGSAALKIKKGGESLGGRMFEYQLPPFQFDEYIERKGRKQASDLWSMRQYPDDLQKFLIDGSFPEIHGETGEICKKYVTSLVEKIVYEDIPSRFDVKHISKLWELARYSASFSSSLFSETQAAGTLGINKGTVSDYLFYLSQSYLSSVLLEEGSYARALQKSKKLFVVCAPIYWALADSFSEGAAAEVAVFDRIAAWGKGVKFYRDYYKREVDFIVDGVPIEVKHRAYIGEADYASLLYYLKAKKKDFGIMVTKDRLDVKKVDGMRVLEVPLSVFLSAKKFEILLKP